MTKTDEYQSGVVGVVSKAREINPAIGSYKEHFVNDAFRFAVRLSNGRVEMSIEVAQDFEAQPSSITHDRIAAVAASFRPTNSEASPAKKYFIHDGNQQQGPFEKEELRAKVIKPTTSIWFEGLSEWTEAGKLDDLKDLFSTPPPHRTAATPPPPKKPTPESKPAEAPPKKKSRRGLVITILVVLLVFIAGTIVVNNPRSIPGVKFEINTPSPIVVTSRADNHKSGLFNAKTTVYATVMNEGGDGNVLITFHIYQGKKAYDRTKLIYLRAGQSEDVNVTFEEVDFISGDITYHVDAVAQ